MKKVKFAYSIDLYEAGNTETLIWIYTVCPLVLEFSISENPKHVGKFNFLKFFRQKFFFVFFFLGGGGGGGT